MDPQSFEATYAQMSDGDLARVLRDKRDLVPEAVAALDREIQNRRIDPSELRKIRPHSIDKRRHPSDVERRLKNKKIRGVWLFVAIVAAFIESVILDHFGILQLFWPINISIIVPAFTIWGHLELKTRLWFWLTLATVTLVHVVFFYFVPWPWGTKWVWAKSIEGLCTLDLIAVFALVSFIEKLLGEDREAQPEPSAGN